MVYKTTRFHIFKRDNFRCQYCGKSSDETILEVDHLVPRSEGGTNDEDNLITSCRLCNKQKLNHEIVENIYTNPKTLDKKVIREGKKERVNISIDQNLKAAFDLTFPIHGKLISNFIEESTLNLLGDQAPDILLEIQIIEQEKRLKDMKMKLKEISCFEKQI